MNARHDEFGREVLDATPIEKPVGWERPESLQDQLRRIVAQQLSAQMVERGEESWEEFNDFDVEDDDYDDPLSGYEVRELEGERDDVPLDPPPATGSAAEPVAPASAAQEAPQEIPEPKS